MMLDGWSLWRLGVVGVGVVLMGMTKGGFPVGSLCLPMLILAWPDQENAAKQVVGFMLPLLCIMDIAAVWFYRRHILWRRIAPLLPGTIIGVLAASLLFLGDSAAVSLSDRWLKLSVGLIGIFFVLYQFARRRVTTVLGEGGDPSVAAKAGLGVAAGVTSTLAHAAGPVAQMYFLPQGLKKMNLAATMVGFFWVLNLAKLLPFGMLGRLQVSNLRLGGLMLPLIPLGVGGGYWLVRRMKSTAYLRFIYAMLLVTSAVLIGKAF